MFSSTQLRGRLRCAAITWSLSLLVACGATFALAQEAAPAKERLWTFSFSGYAMSGKVETALLPTTTDDYADMNPMQRPFGIGIGIDYKLSPNLRVFLDGNVTTFRKLVGIEGENSASFWVYEMTGYESHEVGPFTDDAYFYMDTSGGRIGVKYDFPAKKARPWVGAGLGIYSWKAEYATDDRGGTWGSDDGIATGMTFLAGVDFLLGNATVISLFGDFASPVANPVIEDLFHDGWTWDNVGGNHVMGPYRFGVALGFRK